MTCAWQVIAELDEKKKEALEKTWTKVNQDFGAIFSTLLPGTSAKLEPPEDLSFLAGQQLPPLTPHITFKSGSLMDALSHRGILLGSIQQTI